MPRVGPTIPSRTLRTKVFYPATGAPTASPRPDATPLSKGPFPVVLFSHGFGGSPDGFTGLFKHWIRAGVVIVAPYYPLTNKDSPTKVLRDGLNQPADAKFVLTEVLKETAKPDDPLHGLLDGDRVIAAGHSLGASTTVALFKKCCRDPRFEGAIVLAGSDRLYGKGNWAGSAVPILFVQGTKDTLVPYDDARSTYGDLPWPKAFVTLDGADHTTPYIALAAPYGPVVVSTTVDYLDWLFDGKASAITELKSDATVPGVASYMGTL